MQIKKDSLKKVKEDFYDLRHKFSKKDADKKRKLLYDIKNYRNFSEIEIEVIRKRFNKLEKSLNFKKPRNNSVRSVRRLFEESNRDCYKPRVIDRGFAGEVNNYIKYISEGDKDEKLSPGEYLNMIKPDLRDLINRHKPIERLNNNDNNNNNNNNINSSILSRQNQDISLVR